MAVDLNALGDIGRVTVRKMMYEVDERLPSAYGISCDLSAPSWSCVPETLNKDLATFKWKMQAEDQVLTMMVQQKVEDAFRNGVRYPRGWYPPLEAVDAFRKILL